MSVIRRFFVEKKYGYDIEARPCCWIFAKTFP